MASKVPELCSSVISNKRLKKCWIYFWNLEMNAKLKEQNEKQMTFNVNFTL